MEFDIFWPEQHPPTHATAEVIQAETVANNMSGGEFTLYSLAAIGAGIAVGLVVRRFVIPRDKKH